MSTPPGSSSPPTVSVVIPAFNAGPWIGETLDSALAQTFRDFEVIVIDDGSSDDTVALVEGYGSSVRLLRQRQRGASAARNRGIEASRGEFIAFLDADDLWLPTKLEAQVSLFTERPDLGLTSTLHEAFSEDRVLTGGHRKREYLFNGGNLPHNLALYSGLATPTVMVPRRVLDDVGVFDETLAAAEDDNLWIRITARYPAELVDEVLVRTRMRDGSLSSNLDQLFDDVLTSLDRLMESDPDIRRQIAPAVPLRKSRVHWNRGYHAFDRGELSLARRCFRKALGENIRNRAAWIFLAVSLLPPPVVRVLRSLARGGTSKARDKR